MTMNNVKQIFQNKFTNIGGKLKLDKNEDLLSNSLPTYTDSLYQTAKVNKEICNDMYKKMANICVINYCPSEEKKAKKNQWEVLSAAVIESEKKVSEDILTKDILSSSIKVLDDLSRNTKEFEKSLSLNVIKYFQDLSEDNTLSIVKKTITTLTKDMKSNSERVQNLQEQVNNQSGDSSMNRKSMDISNLGSTENKLANAQLAEENSEKELDTKKDLFLSKLFCSDAERLNTANKMLEFFKEHLEYYIECKNILTKCIPELQAVIDSGKKNYVFHLPLEEHISSTNRKLSYVLETCIQELDNEGTLQEEGLFRISGSKNKVDLLKNALNVMKVDEYIIKSCDAAVFAGVLKQYLRELPVPLMTFFLYDKWCDVGNKIKQNDVAGAKALIKDCLNQMPVCHYDNLVYLMQFLKKIAENESVNKMNSSNLALILGNNLIRNKSINVNDDSDASRVMMLGSPGPGVLEFMITFFYELFPEVPVYVANKKLQNIKIPDKEVEKTVSVKSPKSNADTDSLSSAELLSEESLPINDNDNLSKPLKDVTVLKPKPTRKPPAPPPPAVKPNIPEIEIESVQEVKTKENLDNRPKVKKRTSILEKMSEKYNSEILSPSFSKTGSVLSSSTKRPNVVSCTEPVEKPLKVESVPPKRPNNPPPPIPSFDKLKETLDQKNKDVPVSKGEMKKPSRPTSDMSKPIEEENDSAPVPNVTTQNHSSSDVNYQSTLF